MDTTRTGDGSPSQVDAEIEEEPNVRIELARIQAHTQRYLARWDKIAWITVPLAAAICVALIAGRRTDVNLNVVVGISFALAAPAALAKILWDKRQKVRLREVNQKLETENRELREANTKLQQEYTELREECAELRGRLAEIRRQN